MEIINNKQKLRAYLREARDSFYQLEDIRFVRTKIESNFHILFYRLKLENSILQDKYASIYYPINNEVSPFGVGAFLINEGFDIYLPKITTDPEGLRFYKYISDSDLSQNEFGLMEPIEIEQNLLMPSVLIVPLLGFDKNGFRLGYGKGYFDRFVKHYKNLNHVFITIGLAYHFQYQETLFPEDHDTQLDYVVTNHGIFDFTS